MTSGASSDDLNYCIYWHQCSKSIYIGINDHVRHIRATDNRNVARARIRRICNEDNDDNYDVDDCDGDDVDQLFRWQMLLLKFANFSPPRLISSARPWLRCPS